MYACQILITNKCFIIYIYIYIYIPADVQYRIHIKGGGERSPVYVFLQGSLQSRVVLQLDRTVSTDNDVRQYEVNSANVGEITRIQVAYSSQFTEIKADLGNFTFVSIHKEDNDGFYIERFHQQRGGGPAPIRGRPCKRHFERKLHQRPYNWSGNLAEYQNITDATDCQLKCIEENFSCRLAYYHIFYQSCYVFENADLPLQNIVSVSLFTFRRLDNC
ncbi:uncharacterized protein LOC128549132 [Mercenaria mercenaria]|uniref:uncharacterized protein LOC128549132 n=1 Tax=Mercenaria mercenaria TaxID=6596 RepID=UPI00234F0904|nr:uncharacterized protein LOC128549132 [Mercenaria mercenaria]